MNSTKIRVLIADDNQGLSEQIKKYLLEHTDFELVGITSDSEEEIEMIRELKPNVVITDLKRNQGISGIEVIKRCYELGMTETKFLVETAGYYQDKFKELKELGVNHIILKPYDLPDIVDKIYEIENERVKSLIKLENQVFVNKSIFQVIREKINKILNIK